MTLILCMIRWLSWIFLDMMIQQCLKCFSDITGVDARTVPLNDEATMTLFSSQKALNLKVDKLLDSDVGTFGVHEVWHKVWFAGF